MALVRVWNDNVYPHEERFKGKLITIEPGQYIEMDDDDAQMFKGQFTQILKRGDGTFDPRSFKKIRVERLEAKNVELNPLFHHATGKVAKTQAEFDSWQRQYKHLMVDADERAKVDKAETDEQLAALKADNAELRKEIQGLLATMNEVLAQKTKPRKKKLPVPQVDGKEIEVTYEKTGTE